jgi:hypothetical protein
VGHHVRGLAAVAAALNITDITALWARFETATDLLPGEQFGQFLVSLRERTGLTVNVPRKGGGLVAEGLTQDISQLSQEMVDDDSTYLGNLTEAPARHRRVATAPHNTPRATTRTYKSTVARVLTLLRVASPDA